MTDRSKPVPQPNDTGATTRDAGRENHTIPSDNRFLELAREELDKAVDAEDRSTKNYHVRSALQAIIIVDENGSR